MKKIDENANKNRSLFPIIDNIKGTKKKKNLDNLNAGEINKYFVEIGKKLSKYSVINRAQFGYQAKKNTIDALSEVVQAIRSSLCSRENDYGFLLLYRKLLMLWVIKFCSKNVLRMVWEGKFMTFLIHIWPTDNNVFQLASSEHPLKAFFAVYCRVLF